MSEERIVPLLRAGALLDVGIARDRQEDCIGYADMYRCPQFAALALEKGALFVLSDGAGGHQAGDVASELAVSSTLTTYYAQSGGESEETLVEAIQEANHHIARYSAHASTNARATIVCALIRGRELCAANVGDSRIYLIRDRQILQLSEDHSLVARMVQLGQITPEQAKVHPQRNVVLQAMGSSRDVAPTVHWEELRQGDQVLLCSDGLHGLVDDEDLERVVSRTADPESVCRQLVDLANEAGGSDNISALVVVIEGFGEVKMPPADARATARPLFERNGQGVFVIATQADSPEPCGPEKPKSGLLGRLKGWLGR